jgi:hypothetical protein
LNKVPVGDGQQGWTAIKNQGWRIHCR